MPEVCVTLISDRARLGGRDLAAQAGVDLIQGRKKDSSGRRLSELVARVVSRLTIPVHVVGGIDVETARQAVDAGARGGCGGDPAVPR